jgi:hypothetical protein
MDEKTTYKDLIEELKDPANPLWGGSLAYIAIEESLAMFIKAMRVRMAKPSDQMEAYQKMVLIAQVTMGQSHIMINEDGKIFASLRSAPSQEEKDKIVRDIFPKSAAFLFNIGTISDFLQELYFTTKSSIKNDYVMIADILSACYANLTDILLYEANKMSDGDEKSGLVKRAMDLKDRDTWLDKNLEPKEEKKQ